MGESGAANGETVVSGSRVRVFLLRFLPWFLSGSDRHLGFAAIDGFEDDIVDPKASLDVRS